MQPYPTSRSRRRTGVCCDFRMAAAAAWNAAVSLREFSILTGPD